MTSFQDREKGFEAQYQHDQEQRFKVTARRNRLLGLWAARRLGLDDAAAEAYAKELVMVDFQKPGDQDVVDKLLADFAAKGVPATPAVVRAELEKLQDLAKQQMMKA